MQRFAAHTWPEEARQLPGRPAFALHPRTWLIALLGCIALLIVAHVLVVFGPAHLRWLAPLFDLDEERNVPTWFSCAQLVALAVLCIACAATEARLTPPTWRDRVAWWLIIGLFLGLSLEELVGLHERVSSHAQWVPVLDRLFGESAPAVRDLFGHGYRYSWIVFYAPLIVLAVAFLVHFVLTRFRAQPRLRRVLLLATALFAAVIVSEALAKSQRDNLAVVQVLFVIEESLEMAGASVYLYGFLCYLESLLDNLLRRAAAGR